MKKYSKNKRLILIQLLFILGCHKNASTSDSSLAPTTAERIQAATITAQSHASCTSLGDFYWEIGDKTSALASQAIGTTYGSTSLLSIASASKWPFGAYMVERKNSVLSASDLQALEMGTGYVDFVGCLTGQTVAQCFAYSTNNNLTSGDIGHFNYGGGHFESWANADATIRGMGNSALTTEYATYLGSDIISASTMKFTSPNFAGGMAATPAAYGAYLRKILNNQLQISLLLNSNPICTLPGTCSTAVSSPVPLNWHYSLAHWVEDDSSGDGAFSSPGAFGFYPWIDSSKSYYGIVARQDITNASNPVLTSSYWLSVLCGQKIRNAWMTGLTQ